MKYFLVFNEIRALEDDGSQDFLIQKDWKSLTPQQMTDHLAEKNKLTPSEKREAYLKSLLPLTRRQFKLILLENNLLDKIPVAINSITDPKLKATTQIEWEDATSFERLNPTLNQLYKLMGLKESQVDAMWEDGLKL